MNIPSIFFARKTDILGIITGRLWRYPWGNFGATIGHAIVNGPFILTPRQSTYVVNIVVVIIDISCLNVQLPRMFQIVDSFFPMNVHCVHSASHVHQLVIQFLTILTIPACVVKASTALLENMEQLLMFLAEQ